jgi:hypothetical protein
VIYSNRGGNYQLWGLRPDGTGLRQLTDDPGGINDPVWSPDGRQLALSFKHEGVLSTVGFLDLPPQGIDGIDTPLAIRKPSDPKSYIPKAWSPDGRHLLGSMLLPTGAWAGCVYSIESDRLETVPGPGGNPIVNFEEGAGWLDGNRLVVADQRSRQAYVHDLRSGTSRVVPGIPAPAAFDIGDGGRTLILSRTRSESDIWMLELGE